ncbi:hypothetical protein [Sphingobacterium haloxyli]|nr:hypothetical protein [Sphingobacterium haloxyli]
MRYWYKVNGLNFAFIIYFTFISILQGYAQDQDIIKKAFFYKVNDSLSVEVKISLDDGHPVTYFSHLETDVCSDGLCKPINLTIYWDLLGNFLSYRTDRFRPLTKFDHIEMTEDDHRQLHKILSDTSSLLRDYHVEDMIDAHQNVYSAKADAVTRPTSKTFENVTVEGALYTVYTLWHFVNGGIRQELLEYTSTLFSEPLINHMLQSDNRDYIRFALEHEDFLRQFETFIPQTIALITHSDDYIPHFAVAKLKDSILMDTSCQYKIMYQLVRANQHVKNLLLTRFENIPLHNASITELIINIPTMNVSQLEKVAQILYNNKNSITEEQYNRLRDVANTKNDESMAVTIEKLLKRIE